MRNGNSFNYVYDTNYGLSSYPTYEEWKLVQKKVAFSTFLRSYPTYEEWKHLEEVLAPESFLRSYPTYEEWKLYQKNKKYLEVIQFLSYL